MAPGDHHVGGPLRTAEQFTFGLLVDEAEVKAERLLTLAEVASRFGVPMQMLWEHGPEVWGRHGCSDLPPVFILMAINRGGQSVGWREWFRVCWCS